MNAPRHGCPIIDPNAVVRTRPVITETCPRLAYASTTGARGPAGRKRTTNVIKKGEMTIKGQYAIRSIEP
jgi:hypothetical protein